MKFTREETEDGIMYVLEIEGIAADPDAEPRQSTFQRVAMSEESVQRFMRLQGAAELDEVVSIKIRFVNIRADILHTPIEISAIELDNLINSINMVTGGFMPKQFKGVAFSADGKESHVILK